ncbi:hypothetical protein IV203_029350 [Nitzschia inconspicua]|uniref:Uncharacterized protein n=1 Tax=Nitzschia inconspicua TaxID=303405 RepID=A0A9K3LQF6_9STRA|nr:hypothetical protein IV203_029350 [Nitzschia inconspicua]
MPSVSEVPAVGQVYQNNGKVKAIDEVVREYGNKKHTRKVVTMENGVIYFLDHFVEQGNLKKKTNIKNSNEATIGGSNDCRSNHLGDTLHQSSPVLEDRHNIPSTSNHSDSDSSTSTTKKNNQSPEKKAKRPVVITVLEDDPNNRDQSSIPLSITVYSEKDPNLGPANPNSIRGIWTCHDALEMEDEELWRPQEIFLYRPGEELSTIPEEDSSADSNSLTTGVWGYPEGQNPTSCRGAMGEKDDHDWLPLGGEALVVPPLQEAPADFVPAGKYSFRPGMATWPPPVDRIKKRLREVGKLEVPECFEDGKMPIKVFPRSKMPTAEQQKQRSSIQKKSVSFAQVGQWSYPKGQVEDDHHFLPVNIDLYFGDELPPPATSLAGSEDGSLLSWGLWGNTPSHGSPLDILDDESDESWELPGASLIFPPGVEPDASVEIQGRWAFPLHENVKIEWPPTATKIATVYPKMYAPDIEPGKTQGVWDFEAIDDAEKEQWDPQVVELYGQEEEFDEDRPHGLWGIVHGAKPNDKFDWHPAEVLFSPPGEVPDDDVWIQGKWAFPIERGVKSWPPKPGTTFKKRLVGKLKVPECFKDGKTVPMTVFPRSRMPNECHGKRVGMWTYPRGLEEDDHHLFPQTVQLYFGDHEPDEPLESTSLTYGVWGMDEMDVSDVSGSQDDDDWSPSNSLVYPPGMKPDDGIRVCGKWAVMGEKKISWPLPMSRTALVNPRAIAPAAKVCRIRGVWKFVHDVEPEGASNWKPQQIEIHGLKERLDDTRPYGMWGIRRGASPNKNWNWDPKDVWFYPPGEQPKGDCETLGRWAFPRGKLDVSWPPPVVESPRKPRNVGKLKIPGTFGDKDLSKGSKSVGKLKIPSLFSNT